MLSCPFCKRDKTKVMSVTKSKKISPSNRQKVKVYSVRCNVCHGRGPLTDSEEEAIKLWNGEFGYISKEKAE